MEMNDKDYIEWYDSASQEDRKLHDHLYDLGEYFSDMLFEEGSSVSEMIRCQSLVGDGNYQDDVINCPDELMCFSYNFFKTKVASIGQVGGYFDQGKQLLCISTENSENDSVILHEMIHLHEFVLNGLPLFYHDTLMWSLYIDLRNKISNIDEAISSHAHILNEQSIYDKGGLHDILFLLKSLELDIQMGNQLGTVFGYNAKEILKDLKYKVDA